LIAIIVTRRGLTPLRKMTESLGRIGPDQLKERIGSTGWPRELQPLAIAVIGGLTMALALSLIVTPTIYAIFTHSKGAADADY